MTNSEFSYQFDVLYNNIMSNKAPGLDDYEKSVFLTLAQKEIVLSYYGGRNASGFTFEKTEEVRRALAELVKTEECQPVADETITLSKDSKIYNLPEDLWFITYEAIRLNTDSEKPCLSEKEIQVIPVKQDELYRTLENPFKGPGFRRALRLDIKDNRAEIVSPYKEDIDKYIIRYVAKVSPIILTNLHDIDESVSIDGEYEETPCALHESLHKTILELAVKLAIQSEER